MKWKLRDTLGIYNVSDQDGKSYHGNLMRPCWYKPMDTSGIDKALDQRECYHVLSNYLFGQKLWNTFDIEKVSGQGECFHAF